MSKQRAIEFRAWWPQKGEMVYGIGLRGHGIWQRDGVIPMQFTGVLSKDRVKIFDGDIVRRQNYTMIKGKRKIGNGGRIWVVEWTIGQFSNGWNIASGKDVEIIGNIHENPELIP